MNKSSSGSGFRPNVISYESPSLKQQYDLLRVNAEDIDLVNDDPDGLKHRDVDEGIDLY